MWLLAGLGGLIAGLVMLAREGVPLLKARRTGVIHTRSSRPRPIERDLEPARFDELYAQRSQALAVPGIVIMAALGWLALNGLGLLMSAGGL